jgi:undecaprenyl diphosphate synthase
LKEDKSKRLQQQSDEIKKKGPIPGHIAIIMDGNGRWARSKGLPRIAGHRAGVETVREIVRECSRLDVQYLTLYTFSTENWKRPKSEVSTLMRLLLNTLKKEIQELHENDVRLTTIGDLNALPAGVAEQLRESVETTKTNSGLVLNLALSYSGRWELLEASKKIAADAAAGNLKPDEITESVFSNYLTTKNIPDPDLLIRSSGEFRVSNFLLWQIAYSEIFITKVYWPEFRREHLHEAILDYQRRERRFGKVSEQINSDE